MSRAAYHGVLEKLFAARRAGIDLGLERVRAALDAMGAPDRKTRCSVQIAGTNGKGSTSAFVASALGACGHRVGVFRSPHVLSLRERFVVDGVAVDENEVVAAHRALAAHGENLTFFEQVTAMAAWLFAERSVEMAIYEVGLGGRLDSTTAIDVMVSAVTGVAMDHQAFLGDSLEAIAFEKAGVFRTGGVAVIGHSGLPEALPRLRELAARCARVIEVGERHYQRLPELRMPGEHQKDNAACALAIVEGLDLPGEALPDPLVREGLARAELFGRLQEVAPGLWIDGAHNPHAAAALQSAARALRFEVVVVGMSRDKDARGFFEALGPLAPRLWLGQGTSERVASVDELAVAARAAGVEPEQAFEDLEALTRALDGRGSARVLITGSLLFLGEVLRAAGLGGEADPVVVGDPAHAARR